MSKPIKIILGFVGALVLLGALYFAFAAGTTTPPAGAGPLQSSSVSQNQTQAAIGSDDAALSDKFLTLLLNIRTIKLDQTIFTSPAFISLKDFTTTISPDSNPGRDNPFAPLGSDAAGNIVPLAVVTGQPTSIGARTTTFVGALSAGAIAQSHYFEYGTTNVIPLSNTTAEIQGNPASGVFSFTISGLLPDTTYYVRAVAKVNNTPVYGSVVSWRTLPR